MTGLRQRKKQAAMRHIQHTALELFEKKGFDNVTVEQVAEAAEVSPSSIYRYFTTKEGLVLHDEHDERFLGTVMAELESGAAILDALDTGIGSVAEEHFHRDRDTTLARTKLWASHEGIQAAAGQYVARLSEQLVQAIVRGGCYDGVEARFIVVALLNGMLSAIRSWQLEGASGSPEQYMARGLSALGRVFHEGGDARSTMPSL